MTWFPWYAVGVGTLALATDPVNPSTLYAGTYDGVFKSTDGGASWNPANIGLPPTDPEGYYASVDGLAIDPQNPSTLYAVANPPNAQGEVLFKSIDGGANWRQAGSGLPASDFTLSIDPQNTRTLYAGTGKGVFKSTNGGMDWNSVSAGLPVPFEVYTWAIPLRSIRGRLPLYAWVGNLRDNGIFKSTDGGSSWRAAGSGLPTGTTVDSVAIDAADSTMIYAATGVGVYKSADGGASWAAANSGLTGTRIFDVAVAPQSPVLCTRRRTTGCSRPLTKEQIGLGPV